LRFSQLCRVRAFSTPIREKFTTSKGAAIAKDNADIHGIYLVEYRPGEGFVTKKSMPIGKDRVGAVHTDDRPYLIRTKNNRWITGTKSSPLGIEIDGNLEVIRTFGIGPK
jgi:hypothetical protein